MHAAVQKLFSMTPVDLKTALPKLNETRTVVKIVEDDADLLRLWARRRARWGSWTSTRSIAR